MDVARLRHAFTVDVEEWYHKLDVGTRECERRLDYGLKRLLAILEEYNVRGTFFWLGCAAVEYPHLVRQVVQAGHEIGCHGWSHELIYRMQPQQFRRETVYALATLTELVGVAVAVYRAAFFSITRQSLWALEILAEAGFRYDSSIFPVRNWRMALLIFTRGRSACTHQAGLSMSFPSRCGKSSVTMFRYRVGHIFVCIPTPLLRAMCERWRQGVRQTFAISIVDNSCGCQPISEQSVYTGAQAS